MIFLKQIVWSLLILALVSCQSIPQKPQMERPEVVELAVDDEKAISEKLGPFKIEYKSTSGWNAEYAVLGFLYGSTENQKFLISPAIPLEPGVIFGWSLYVKSKSNKPIELTEKMTLPEPARQFKINSDTTTISEDGKQVTSQLKLQPSKNWIRNHWQILPGDPDGVHIIELFDGTKLIHRFRFEIVKKPKNQN